MTCACVADDKANASRPPPSGKILADMKFLHLVDRILKPNAKLGQGMIPKSCRLFG
jgi:hypothetical protein